MLKAHEVEYEPTTEDKLWLARAVQAEGKPELRVARALVNLFMLQRAQGRTQTLAGLVRAYAQPVNPRWYEHGDLFLAHPRSAHELEVARNRERVHSTRISFAPLTMRAVREALETPFPSDVTDYGAASLDASMKYAPRSEPIAGENRFWSRRPGWAGYFTAASTSVAVWALLFAAAYAAWGRA